MDKRTRTDLFLACLRDAPACASATEALEQIARTLDGVENEFTSIPHNPAAWESDGRMYPPQADSRRVVEGHPELRRYRSVGHSIWVADSGAIMIELANGGERCLDKPGTDGRTITEQMADSASRLSSPASRE